MQSLSPPLPQLPLSTPWLAFLSPSPLRGRAMNVSTLEKKWPKQSQALFNRRQPPLTKGIQIKSRIISQISKYLVLEVLEVGVCFQGL